MHNHFKRDLLISVGAIAGSIVGFGIFYYVMTDHLAARALEISRDRQLDFQISHSSELLAKYKEAAPLAQKYQQKIDRLLPDQYRLLSFRSWIEGLGKIRQLQIKATLQLGALGGLDSNIGFAPFALDITGSSENINLFLDDLEGSPTQFLVALDGIDVTRTGTSDHDMVSGRVFFKMNGN